MFDGLEKNARQVEVKTSQRLIALVEILQPVPLPTRNTRISTLDCKD